MSSVTDASDLLSRLSTEQLAAELLRRTASGETWDPELAGRLSMLIEHSADDQWNRFSRKRLAALFNDRYWFRGCDELGFEGATILDVGCGSWNPFAWLMIYIQLGAERGIGVDLDELTDPDRAARGLARAAGYMLLDPRLIVDEYPITRAQVACHTADFDLQRLRDGDLSGLPAGRMIYRRESITDLGLADREVDFAVSSSFLEHVAEVDEAVAELARVTRPGGFGVHGIDGTDHRRYNHPDISPLQLLGEETDAELVHGSNRRRPLQFVEVFEAQGFEVLEVRPWFPIEITEQLRSTLVEPYRSLPDETLKWGSARLFVRRR